MAVRKIAYVPDPDRTEADAVSPRNPADAAAIVIHFPGQGSVTIPRHPGEPCEPSPLPSLN